MKFYRITETAVGGSIGTGSIAARQSPLFSGGPNRREVRSGENDWRSNAPREREDKTKLAVTRQQLEKAKQLKQQKQKSRFSDFASRLFTKRTMSEGKETDISGVVSRLKGLEQKNDFDARNTVTYGVEDDEGNLMKITVPTDQSKSFEHRLSGELGEIENNKIYGYENSGVSLAEILFNMRNEFKIVDVEFPEVPADAIYNMDKATMGNNIPEAQGMQNDMGMDNGMGDDQGLEGQDDMTGDLSGQAGDDMGMDDGMGGENPDDMDHEGVEDFPEDDMGGEGDIQTMFKQLIGLMTAQAEKDKAVADAEAEKARALQAEYTANAANAEVGKQEELMRMEAGLEMQKKKEKDAKRIANLAKYRVNQASQPSANNFEGFTSILGAVLTEENDLDDDLGTEQMVRNEMRVARQKYQIIPTDDSDTQNYKRSTMQNVMNQLNEKLKQIRNKTLYAQRQQQAAAKAAQVARQTGQPTGQTQGTM